MTITHADQSTLATTAGTEFAALAVPAGLRVRVRTRDVAGNVTVIRADGRVWRNTATALDIGGLHPLRQANDLILTGRDGPA